MSLENKKKNVRNTYKIGAVIANHTDDKGLIFKIYRVVE